MTNGTKIGATLGVLLALLPGTGRPQDSTAAPKPQFSIEDPLPYGQQPVDYFGASTDNPAERLNQRLQHGRVQLDAEPTGGYLTPLLRELGISPASQTLVYSKTALNPKLVTPQTPRAIYFNEDCYVAWVPGALALEIAAVDPQKGFTFYTLTQPAPPEKKMQALELKRETQCLACHGGPTALRIPGGLARSFVTDAKGNPLSGYSRITQNVPLEKRFGGWYVTGWKDGPTHHGNLFGIQSEEEAPAPTSTNADDLSRFFDAASYLSPRSDVVAQLVLHHQLHGQNLLIRAGYESRFNKRSDTEDQLVRYLLFADEAPLTGTVERDSPFARWFAGRGRQDPQGRSLREWDLNTRLFKYRLSYLIETPLFDGLPAEVKQRICHRLGKILTAKDPSAPFDNIPADERRAILEIVEWPGLD